ncbi:MAG: hypothetical protein ACSLFQ_02785 [Thermoanaerobaculia bacterium]
MRCDDFRASLAPETELGPDALVHLRECEACLNHAVSIDPELMFRGLGGEIEPPGGVDAFVAEVMQDVRFRGTEKVVDARGRFAPAQRWAVAAAATIAIISGTLFWPRADRGMVPHLPVASIVSAPEALSFSVSSRPVIENYASTSATIIEVPSEETSDLKVVMIFDESLPADL